MQPGKTLQADDRRGAPGRGGAGSRRSRRPVLAQGRDRDRDGPRHRRDPGPGQLAAGQRQRPGRRAGVGQRGPGGAASTTSRARRSRRSPSPARSRTASSPRARSSTSRSVLQVADRQIHDAEAHGDETLTVAQDPQGLQQHRRRRDRHEARAHRASTTGSTGSASARPTGVDLPGEEAGSSCSSSQYSGSSMGNLPMGQGESVTPIQMATAYSAIANGGILRPPHIVAVDRRQAGQAAGRAPDHLRRPRPPSCATCSAACSPTAAPPRARRSRATTWPARPAPPTWSSTASTPAPTTSPRSSGWCRPAHPKLVVAVMVDEPHGAIYGGSVAAPAFQKIVGWAVPYLGISPR